MPLLQCFPPIADRTARVLILGSMPGAASLAAQRYYAHGQNAFWPIMGALLGVAPTDRYEARIAALQTAQIALWDVLQFCTRQGSLDNHIERESEVANDFPAFLNAHPNIQRIGFNGTKAETSFRRLVLPNLPPGGPQLFRLPSTSPAHAALSFDDKLNAWRAILLPASF